MNKKLLVEHKNILSEGMQFHLIENIGIENNVYRPGSSKYFSLFREVRDLSEIGLYELSLTESYYINETEINLYDANIILFIKNLFETDLNEMYDIEYSIMNHLKFNPSVFNMYGLPELRIFLNKFIKEKEDSKKREGGNTNPTI